MEYKLLAFGDNRADFSKRGILELSWAYDTASGMESRREFIQLDTLPGECGLMKVIPAVKQGDSLELRFRGDFSMFTMLPDSQQTIYRARLEGSYDSKKQMPPDALGRYRFQELKRKWMGDSAFSPEKGIWIKQVRPASMPQYEKGEEVLLHFHGRSADGAVQDTMFAHEDAFRIMLGQEMLLIPGLATAAHHMAPGGEYLVLLAPDKAFGLHRTRVKAVPPYTPMLYCVHAVDPFSKETL